MDMLFHSYIGGTPEQVWNVLTLPEQTQKIYEGSFIESTMETGSPFNYIGPDSNGNIVHQVCGKVLEYTPSKRLSHTYYMPDWIIAGHESFASRVIYELTPVGNDCTHLKVTHDQWKNGDPAYEGTLNAWWKILSMIKTLVETEEVLGIRLHG